MAMSKACPVRSKVVSTVYICIYISLYVHLCITKQYMLYTILFTTDNPTCDIHQINGAEEEATVVGNSATVMFEGTGPSSNNVVSDFRVILQQQQPDLTYLDIGERNCADVSTPGALELEGMPVPGMTVQCSVDSSKQPNLAHTNLHNGTLC